MFCRFYRHTAFQEVFLGETPQNLHTILLMRRDLSY
jgi:hypothetical protein